MSIGEKKDETEDLERLCQGVSPNEGQQGCWTLGFLRTLRTEG